MRNCNDGVSCRFSIIAAFLLVVVFFSLFCFLSAGRASNGGKLILLLHCCARAIGRGSSRITAFMSNTSRRLSAAAILRDRRSLRVPLHLMDATQRECRARNQVTHVLFAQVRAKTGAMAAGIKRGLTGGIDDSSNQPEYHNGRWR
jgi:hypothetical protein